MEKYVQEIVSLLHLYQKYLPEPPEEIKTAIQKSDINFLLDDLFKVIQSMQVGTNRVIEIVSSLNSFSRHREAGKKLANLHEGIESTLLILGHRFKANADRPAIQIIKEYGNLPPIECFPGEINQVFMNLICNAIDAIEQTHKNKSFKEISLNPGRIKIKTEVIGEQVILKIADNGSGISRVCRINEKPR